MQVQTPEVGVEKATTPAEHRLVSVEQLKKIHRDLHACQRVIWLAGCRPRGYGFDPSYCTDAQERLKEIEVLLAQTAPAQDEREEAPHIPLSVGVDATKDGAHVCLMVKGYGDVTHVIHSHFYAARQDGTQVVASIAASIAQSAPTQVTAAMWKAAHESMESDGDLALAIQEALNAARGQIAPQPEQSGLVAVLERIKRDTRIDDPLNHYDAVFRALSEYRRALPAQGGA